MSSESCCQPEPSCLLLDLPPTRPCSPFFTLNPCTLPHLTHLTTECHHQPNSTRKMVSTQTNMPAFLVKNDILPSVAKSRRQITDRLPICHQQRFPRRSHAETFPTASTVLDASFSTHKDPLDRVRSTHREGCHLADQADSKAVSSRDSKDNHTLFPTDSNLSQLLQQRAEPSLRQCKVKTQSRLARTMIFRHQPRVFRNHHRLSHRSLFLNTASSRSLNTLAHPVPTLSSVFLLSPHPCLPARSPPFRPPRLSLPVPHPTCLLTPPTASPTRADSLLVNRLLTADPNSLTAKSRPSRAVPDLSDHLEISVHGRTVSHHHAPSLSKESAGTENSASSHTWTRAETMFVIQTLSGV